MAEKPAFVEQTVIIKKDHPNAPNRKAAMKVAQYHTGRASKTIRETKSSFRVRQRPVTCFVPGSFRTKCRGKKKLTCVTYGRLKPSARDRQSCR
jgi:hypothetical protein